MKIIHTCPLCGNENLDVMDCSISPFVSYRVWDKAPFALHYLHCRPCKFMFYDVRPEDHEMARLYKDYRGKKYCEDREQYESGYSKINQLLANNPSVEDRRRRHLDQLLAKVNWKADPLSLALDYGGDDGRFFGESFADAKKYVYEISDVTPIPGVQAITTLDKLRSQTYDFIMNSNVLEHVSDPVGFLGDLRLLGNANTLYYFEIPSEYPTYAKLNFQMGKLRSLLTKSAAICRLLKSLRYVRWKLVSGKPNSFSGIIKFTSLGFEMHEHINTFSMKAAQELLIRSGFKIEYSETDVFAVDWSTVKMLCILARIQVR